MTPRGITATALILAATGLALHAPMANAQRSALSGAQEPQRSVRPPEPRDRASQIINPHLGPRWPNGQLRDGASQIINPPVQQQQQQQQTGASDISSTRHSLSSAQEERRDQRNQRDDGRQDDRRWQDRRDDGIYRRR